MAHKKGQGSSRNGRDSNSQRLGVKAHDGNVVSGGTIIVRQRGRRFRAGLNAGLGKGGPFLETDLAQELEIIDVNVRSTVQLTKHVLRDMAARRRGKVLITSSISLYNAPGGDGTKLEPAGSIYQGKPLDDLYQVGDTHPSATAIVRMAREARPRYPGSSLTASEVLTAQEVYLAGKQGDELAIFDGERNVVDGDHVAI